LPSSVALAGMPPRSVPTEAGPATLEASLSFEAPYLIEKLVNDHVCDNEDEARALFREVKRYLFLNRADQSKLWEMHSLRVDEVWHQFILFTRQYADFCTRYYGAYSPHSPSNAPVSAKNSARQKQVATFKEFHAYYEKVFGEPLPDHWYDERNVCLHSRVLDARIGKLLLKEEGGKVELVDGAGEVVFAVNSLAAQAISFIADTGAFYVRELPGDLDDDEKVALVATLVEHKMLRLAS
jgi:hypothetical protein